MLGQNNNALKSKLPFSKTSKYKL